MPRNWIQLKKDSEQFRFSGRRGNNNYNDKDREKKREQGWSDHDDINKKNNSNKTNKNNNIDNNSYRENSNFHDNVQDISKGGNNNNISNIRANNRRRKKREGKVEYRNSGIEVSESIGGGT